MSEDVQLKVLDSFDRMLEIIAEDCEYEWVYEDECEESEELPGMECKVPEVEAEG